MTTQRDRLAAVLHDLDEHWFPFTDESDCVHDDMADALIARGVRVVDAETLAQALHRGCGITGSLHAWEPCPTKHFYRAEATQTIKRLDGGD